MASKCSIANSLQLFAHSLQRRTDKFEEFSFSRICQFEDLLRVSESLSIDVTQNWTDGQFILGFDYGTDLVVARMILLDTVNSTPGVLTESKQSRTLIQDAGLYKISIITQYWINTINSSYSGTEIKSDAIKSCLAALKSQGIEITSHQLRIEDIPDA